MRLGAIFVSRLFISHSGANNAAAIALGQWLSEQGYDDIFLDVDPDRGLVAGERWQEALKAAADRCEAVLFLVSPAWLASKWCLAEFLLAKTLHKRIFGLIIEPVPSDRLPTEMTAEWQLCELVGEDRFRSFEIEIGTKHNRVDFREAGLDLLRRGLERAGLDARSFPWPPASDPKRAPYRGLSALEPEDAAIFFGRDAAIVRGLDRIRGLVEGGAEKVLVILGGSGSGKSSFLRAGLWPRLLRDDATFLPLPVIRPETKVITGSFGLSVALATAFERLGSARPPGRIKEALTKGAEEFGKLLDELSVLAKRRLVGTQDGQPAPAIILALDQAEELFNADGVEEAATFLELLAGVLGGSQARRILVVITIRSDRYELLQAEPHLRGLKQDLFNLPPIPVAEFKTVIEGPARRVVEKGGRLTIDPALTERLIADSQGADALPLLGFTLERIYADYGSAGRLTVAEYDKIGGVQGSIEEAITRTFAHPERPPTIPASKDEQLAYLRAAFIPWLARFDPDSNAPMRRMARLDELPDSSRAVVRRLVDARLLVANRREGVDVIEVAHEAILRQWPALIAWLQAESDDLKLIEEVERAANEWIRSGRHETWLDHRAERLYSAERLGRRQDFRRRLGHDGIAYLTACRRRESVAFRQAGVDLLRRGLERAGLDARSFPWPPASDPKRAPYRGARAFETQDVAIFFGRDDEIVRALDRIRGLAEGAAEKLLIILGASGVGKSSFLCAGLWPRIARYETAFVPLPVIRPGMAAISGETGLLPALEAAFQAANIPTTRTSLRTAVEGGAATLRPLLQSLADKATPAAFDHDIKPKPPTLIISIDQGEELFLVGEQNEARAFLALIRELLSNDAQELVVLFTIRSDAYESLQNSNEFQGVRQETISLPPMRKGSYSEVIKGPVLRLEGTECKLEIDENLIVALLTDIDAGAAKDALPLLAFTLERLYVECGGRRRLTLADYEALGGTKGSIEAAVESAFEAADTDPAIPKDRDARLALLRRGLIPWLASIDPDTGSPRRRVARRSEIPEEARPLIEHLVNQRLLTTDISKETGEQTIEPVHEVLLRQWGRLQGWLAEDAGLLGVLAGVKRASQDWAVHNKDAAWLTHATHRLQAAERLRDRPDLAANFEKIDWDYLAWCHKHERLITRRARLVLASVGVLFVIFIAGFVGWLNEGYLEERLNWYTSVRPYMLNQVWPYVLTAEAERALKPGSVFKECAKDCPMMIVVPAGEFVMGSAMNERGRVSNEGPQHKVTIAYSFAISRFEVTFDEWDTCVAFGGCAPVSDSDWGRGSRPVINVSWQDAQRYVAWFSKMTGQSYRLITEAEWEYAARAGTNTAYSWGDEIGAMANCDGCGSQWDNKQTAPVGSFAPNAFGLHDMHGNVLEWVEDCYRNSYAGAPTDSSAVIDRDCSSRVVRGGSWNDNPRALRSAYRGRNGTDGRNLNLGFRLGRTLSITP